MKNRNSQDTKKKATQPDPTADGYSRSMLNKANENSPYGEDEPNTRISKTN
ncbi:hypothetical protein [Clostridium sp.]|uniref:hypothetical protein n=1 Tax=Clostridium sp. TaxID=1506 RepID=UPI002FC83C17